MDIKVFEETLDEEIDVFVINHSIDADGEKELRFIINAFCKFLARNTGKPFEENLKAFDTSLEVLIDTFYETGFKSNAHLFYHQLPSIQNRINEGKDKLRAEIKQLNEKNKKLNKDLATTKRELVDANAKIDTLKDEIRSLKYSRSSSYGSCGGSSSYGRC